MQATWRNRNVNNVRKNWNVDGLKRKSMKGRSRS
jgi:hypothetical protein